MTTTAFVDQLKQYLCLELGGEQTDSFQVIEAKSGHRDQLG